MDPCIFNVSVNGVQCTVVIYVADLFITSEDLESHLKSKFKDLTVHCGENSLLSWNDLGLYSSF